ncbi:MAG: 30S ribosome-binding factor RbfA, partial [Rhodospirillales bacterium]|nr:30S ribosome-binding factor RbfA [Rhodospirillales bacterium]
MNRREGKTPSQRQLRVGEELRHALAWLLERGDFHDQELTSNPVTVTEVRIGPDLRNATVYITPLGGGDASEVLTALNRARPFLRRQIASRIRLKFVPNIHFESDPSFDHAYRIERILLSPEVARDTARDANGKDDG